MGGMTMQRRCWTGVLVLAFIASPAPGAVKLEWKLKEGDQFFLQEKTKTRETITFMGKPYEQNLDHTRVSRFTVLKKDQDGGYLLEQKILQVQVERGGKKAVAGKRASAKLLQDMQGATFKLTLSPKMRITKFEGYDALMKKMAGKEELGKKEDVGKQARALITENSLVKPLEALFGFLPAKEVARGDEWTYMATRPLGVMGSLKLTGNYTYKADKKNDAGDNLVILDVINARARYFPARTESGLAFRLVKGDFKLDRKNTNGTITWNVTRGRMVSAEQKTKLSGTVTMDAMGTTVAMDVELQETVVTTVSAKNPLKKNRK
jgi:hypothetical protein